MQNLKIPLKLLLYAKIITKTQAVWPVSMDSPSRYTSYKNRLRFYLTN